MDDRRLLTFAEAEALLPAGETVHTFRSGRGLMLGADWDKRSVLEALNKAETIDVSGPVAQAMNHGLAINDEHGWLFIETMGPNAQVKPHD